METLVGYYPCDAGPQPVYAQETVSGGQFDWAVASLRNGRPQRFDGSEIIREV